MKILKTIQSIIPYSFDAPNDMGIEYFRHRFLHYLLLCTFVLGIIVYLPCVYFAYKYDLPEIILIDTMTIVMIAFLSFDKRLGFTAKTYGILAVLYLLGLGLLIGVGPMGAGFLWLVMFSAMTGVLIGTRPVFYSLGINMLTVIILTIFVYFKQFAWADLDNIFGLWIVMGVNFLCINAIISISVSILLSKLNQLHKTEKQRSIELKTQIKSRIQTEKENEKLANQVLHTQKMEALGTLAGGVAHDFNNVLSAILGYAELSLLDLDEQDEIYKNIENICIASDRAKGIVHQILTFSRHTHIEKSPWPIGSIIHECGKLFQVGIPSQISFSMTDPIDNSNMVLADRTQIYQVIMNLCTNALHAIGDSQGTITLSFELETINLDNDLCALLESKTYYKISVNDTGCGIKKEHLPRIFEPYYTTRHTGKGTGMGLAIAHGIIKNHGGEIIVSSTPGKGSTFCLYLPVHDSPISHSQTTSDINVPHHGTENILFVDDEEHLLVIGKNYLTRMGYTVHIETDPVAALNTFKKHPDSFHLIITDKKMPNMSGDILKDKIKKNRPDIPIILCSGFANESENNGYDIILTKPVKNETLGKAIRKVLDLRIGSKIT